MPMNWRIHRVWELLDSFKDECELRGWKTSEHQDWVTTDSEKYHNFLWIRTVHPTTFEKICAERKVAVRGDVSYQVVDVSYIAWLFLQSPTENIIRKVREYCEYSKKIAIYDLSQAFTGEPLCLKLNRTDSRVFKEFEKFLEWEWGIEVKPTKKMVKRRVSPRARSAEVIL